MVINCEIVGINKPLDFDLFRQVIRLALSPAEQFLAICDPNFAGNFVRSFLSFNQQIRVFFESNSKTSKNL